LEGLKMKYLGYFILSLPILFVLGLFLYAVGLKPMLVALGTVLFISICGITGSYLIDKGELNE
jgi:hypothetical protein